MNKVLCCEECNHAKADRLVKEFLKSRKIVYLGMYMKKAFKKSIDKHIKCKVR